MKTKIENGIEHLDSTSRIKTTPTSENIRVSTKFSIHSLGERKNDYIRYSHCLFYQMC